MIPGVLELAGDLVRRRRAFVLATVVWRRSPTSGKQGSKAVILPDGTVRGWLAGACAEPTVIAEARAAMADGHPRLLFLGPADELDGVLRAGVTTVPLACESEGALEVYLEPNLPPPHVIVIGRASRHSPTPSSGGPRSSTTRGRQTIPTGSRWSRSSTSPSSASMLPLLSSSRRKATTTRRPSRWRSPLPPATWGSSRRASARTPCANTSGSAGSPTRRSIACARRPASTSVFDADPVKYAVGD